MAWWSNTDMMLLGNVKTTGLDDEIIIKSYSEYFSDNILQLDHQMRG